MSFEIRIVHNNSCVYELNLKIKILQILSEEYPGIQNNSS